MCAGFLAYLGDQRFDRPTADTRSPDRRLTHNTNDSGANSDKTTNTEPPHRFVEGLDQHD